MEMEMEMSYKSSVKEKKNQQQCACIQIASLHSTFYLLQYKSIRREYQNKTGWIYKENLITHKLIFRK